ncbi:helix-turn-helix domain-containing protein [Isoptericola sp. b441]|uniref:Helix-turn-helix domain-containing protein n=1 Tax=Actinotalea lenta TaxID=3064654 RepID=A0ABT9D9A8_9CELL|nr:MULTISPECIES: helix-turn-helix domain-containing protein [unclassified Isoptericola]MDO8107493.1 helix-turn-helix domain-containing protein [Isoptericola sp. b441]MDO8120847.1 helix-turn-helix domain-containing protein [Isoptericola sp. b490]
MDTPEIDSSTRARILHLVVEAGPVSVLELAHDLDLTPAGVRRHIAALEDAGQVAVHSGRPAGSQGRGRPARRYVATLSAQAALDCTYAELAEQALGYLAQVAGEQAVEEFAERRAADLEASLEPAVDGAPGLRDRTERLASALSTEGYAASVRSVPGGMAVQLCQGHCPVRDVAARYPALCEAETRALSRLLGVHVQRLSTLASGGHVCTTHVPVAALGVGTSPSRGGSATAHRPTGRRTAAVEGDR